MQVASISFSTASITYRKNKEGKMANKIKGVDFHCLSNNAAHSTIEITTRQLIVRRGQPFLLTLEMMRPFRAGDPLTLTAETGPAPSERDGTRSSFGNPSPMYSADVKSIWKYEIDKSAILQRGKVTLSVTPPAEAPVGKYSLSASTVGENMTLGSLVVLFNPWCSDDWVYLPHEAERQEYVMNEQGLIYRGTAHNFHPMQWVFGQFEEEMVDICLKLLDVNPKHKRDPVDDVSARCNPIYVSRVISAMINSNDDLGVLMGRWDDNYDGGFRPTSWIGSVSILQRWYQSGCRAVKYGQCWVFAAVMCTVMRFFGIPCRVVSNFNSAHDRNNSLTIDEYYNEYGIQSGEGKDSIWNFHVWVEGWMKRPDLMKGDTYDGWQVLDPTPQEMSDGVFCCGPAPVNAILQGETTLKYDVPFIFAEVNADIVKWMVNADGSKKKMTSLTDTGHVGQKISTKAVGYNGRNDLTNSYKYAEGSTMERVVFDHAVKRVNSRDEDPGCGVKDLKKVDMTIEEETTLQNAKDIKLNLKLCSRDYTKRMMYIYINAQAMKYTGKQVRNFLHVMHQISLLAGQDVTIPIQIPFSVYHQYIVGFDSMKVSVIAKDDNGDLYETETDLALEDPPISIKVLGEARLNRPMTVEVEFENPLNETLRFCSLTVIGCGLFRSDYVESNIFELEPNSALRLKITTTPYKVGLKTILADFDCSAFRDVKGSCSINVKP